MTHLLGGFRRCWPFNFCLWFNLRYLVRDSLWNSFVSFDKYGVMTGFWAHKMELKAYEKSIKSRNFALTPVLRYYTNLASYNTLFSTFLRTSLFIALKRYKRSSYICSYMQYVQNSYKTWIDKKYLKM
jgi:hypothetical protein